MTITLQIKKKTLCDADHTGFVFNWRRAPQLRLVSGSDAAGAEPDAVKRAELLDLCMTCWRQAQMPRRWPGLARGHERRGLLTCAVNEKKPRPGEGRGSSIVSLTTREFGGQRIARLTYLTATAPILICRGSLRECDPAPPPKANPGSRRLGEKEPGSRRSTYPLEQDTERPNYLTPASRPVKDHLGSYSSNYKCFAAGPVFLRGHEACPCRSNGHRLTALTWS